MLSPVLEQLGISLLLGLLVGLQREHDATRLAGLRTFPLITLLGTLAGLLDQYLEAHGLVVAAGLISVLGVVVIGNLHELKSPKSTPGTTTEIAMLVMFGIGAYLVFGERALAVVAGAVVAVLLEFKPQMHGFVAKLKDDDLRHVMRFVLISCVVLPVLPDQAYGPFEVFNPFETWLMVVLIVGISLGGYVMFKFFGQGAGTLLGGLLGGAVSSTATTVSYSRTSTKHPDAAGLAALVIMVASTVVYVRVLIEIATVSPAMLPHAVPPIACLLAMSAVVIIICWLATSRAEAKPPELKNPTELKSAIVFGLMYVGVLFALAAAKQWLGGTGLYVVAALSGLTDVDAITLSTARMVNQAPADPASADASSAGITPAFGWRLIVVALLANLAFKTGLTAVLGSRGLLARMALLFAAPFVVGVLLILFWPEGWTLPITGEAAQATEATN